MLFPLPLTPFEYYYWCDDRPEYPTTYPMTLTFSGVIDGSCFERALGDALVRHPMLGAQIEELPSGVPVWVEGHGRAPAVDWAAEDVPIGHPAGEMIDLRTSGGLRVWVRQGATSARVLLQFHHACCDGIGALRFAEDLMVCYARRVGCEDSATLRPVQPALLVRRGGVVPPPGLATLIRDWGIGAYEWAKLLVRSPRPVAATAVEPARSPPPYLGYETVTLDAAQTARLRAAAAAQGATFNDLLLRDLFQTLRQWNARHDGQPRGWLRINMPTSLRGRGDQLMPAANMMGFTFLTRTTGQCARQGHLLQSIRRETEVIKRWQLGLYFLGGLAAGAQFRGVIPWMLRREQSFATAVLSNVGRIFGRVGLPRNRRHLVCGNLVLDQLTGVPPIRPLTRAAICAITYNNQTTLSLRCDPHCFGAAQTGDLLGDFAARLNHSARGG